MSADYQLNKKQKVKKKRGAKAFIIPLLVLAILAGITYYIIKHLKPETVIQQSAPKISRLAADAKTTHYDEPYFGIDISSEWQPVQRPPGTYQSYTWSSGSVKGNAEEITIYEDTIPVNFAPNKVLIITGEQDHLQVEGSVSDNCANYTKGMNHDPGLTGVPAKWQNVDFLCDQYNVDRDVVATASTDGVNFTNLLTADGQVHKYLFTFTDHSQVPNYGSFYAALQSFKMH